MADPTSEWNWYNPTTWFYYSLYNPLSWASGEAPSADQASASVAGTQVPPVRSSSLTHIPASEQQRLSRVRSPPRFVLCQPRHWSHLPYPSAHKTQPNAFKEEKTIARTPQDLHGKNCKTTWRGMYLVTGLELRTGHSIRSLQILQDSTVQKEIIEEDRSPARRSMSPKPGMQFGVSLGDLQKVQLKGSNRTW